MPYNILIVDDSGSMRKVIKKVLRLSGFKMGDCLEAGNGREALDVLEDNWVDLILSDIHMPGDGWFWSAAGPEGKGRLE